ncbi:hypothetical protein DPMN_074998 [Dreissena polymorpha]|uniref:Uncharacterized protein n=1 Tax=Dreissena polymorpha TaxID=45954 RepID=A0A9D3YGD1_DREPO|nr:hypothetical protein DPMN_074998 [Dreissena polymorpha]
MWTLYAKQGKKYPAPGGHVFQPIGTLFELVQYIIGTNRLTEFHEDQTINVASRPSNQKYSAPGGHVFQQTRTTFKLIQYIIGRNTKLCEVRTKKSASRVLTRQMMTPHDG